MVQQLRPCASCAEGLGSIPDQRTKIPHAARYGTRTNKKPLKKKKGNRRKEKKKYLIEGSAKCHMCFLEKRYRNSEEGQVAITLTLEIGTFFIFYVDMTNQW